MRTAEPKVKGAGSPLAPCNFSAPFYSSRCSSRGLSLSKVQATSSRTPPFAHLKSKRQMLPKISASHSASLGYIAERHPGEPPSPTREEAGSCLYSTATTGLATNKFQKQEVGCIPNNKCGFDHWRILMHGRGSERKIASILPSQQPQMPAW